ncbi:uncharacterized protein NPIL_374131 [Nephila pilipes]|uniref:Uncharacterized protein n=1 Tax=Nephila pilipes TaxID=299642 RepID=A0A8X6TRV5_NEPPI|nr:uncharacterized protein NPIL_374131 [Nephila pilipes]
MASPKATSEDENEGERIVKRNSMIPDWGADAKNSVHLWCRSSASGDLCYVSSNVCLMKLHSMYVEMLLVVTQELRLGRSPSLPEVYLDMLEQSAFPQLQHMYLLTIFQHDSAPSHWSLHVKEALNVISQMSGLDLMV